MIFISQQQLQAVFARRKIQHRLGLTLVEMEIMLVPRQGLIEIWQLVHIDQQVMMACLMPDLRRGSRRRNAKPLDAEFHLERAVNSSAILQADKVNPRMTRRRMRNCCAGQQQ